MKRLKQLARWLRAWTHFLFGWSVYAVTGRTPAKAYQSMIYLFCHSGGKFNDRVSSLIAKFSRKADLSSQVGILGKVSSEFLSANLDQLKDRGYLVFPSALSPEACDRLMAFALATPAQVRRMDDEPETTVKRLARYEPGNPLAVRYDYPSATLLNNADVQDLLADPSLIAIAQEYLGCLPKADVLSMWWHTNFHSQPDSEAAQFYHFDMDRLKWLKVFIYLTNVGPGDGAHSFIEGSHRAGAIPEHMLNKGYVRLSDSEVLSHYTDAKQVDFCAPRGTVIVEDTRGLHKGNAVEPGGTSRLILQLQFSNSLFGTNYPSAKISQVCSPALADLLRSYPSIYDCYHE